MNCFVIFALLLITAGLAISRDWSGGSDVKFDFNCKFNAGQLQRVGGTGAECKKLCYRVQQCTHFSQGDGICLLQRSTDSLQEQSLPNHGELKLCGFIPGRSSQPV